MGYRSGYWLLLELLEEGLLALEVGFLLGGEFTFSLDGGDILLGGFLFLLTNGIGACGVH